MELAAEALCEEAPSAKGAANSRFIQSAKEQKGNWNVTFRNR